LALATLGLLICEPALAGPYVYSTFNEPDSIGNPYQGVGRTYAFSINDSGQITGEYGDAYGPHGFVYSGGTYSTLDVPGANGTELYRSNNAGEIVGRYFDTSHPQGAAFLYTGGNFTDISFPGAAWTYVFGINNAGDMVGTYNFGGPQTQSSQHGFIYSGSVFTTIDVPGGYDPQPLGINDAGQIVGLFGDGTGSHGFLDNGGVFSKIDAPGAFSYTYAFDINNDGQIVGFFDTPTGDTNGFLYTGGAFTDIAIPHSSIDLPDTFPLGINNLGQVVGYGLGDLEYFGSGAATTEHAFIATPTPAPATLPLFATGLGLMALLAWRRKAHRA
jgi:probable HAF family extracellular repeat protein